MCIDSTGLVLPQIDELPSRAQCVGYYKRMVKQQQGASADGAASVDGTASGAAASASAIPVVPAVPAVPAVSAVVLTENEGKTTQELANALDPLTKVISTSDIAVEIEKTPDNAPVGVDASKHLQQLSAVTATGEVPLTQTLTPTASASVTAAPLKSAGARKATTVLAKSGTGWVQGGSNLNPETESDTILTWEHLKDGNSGSGASGAAGSGGAGKIRRAASGSRSSQLSLSYLCGRQWGQDGVTAELSGAAATSSGGSVVSHNDWDAEGGGGADFSSELLPCENRLFIGATSRAVKASRATKSFAKLNNMKPPAAAAEREKERERKKKKQLPKEVADAVAVGLADVVASAATAGGTTGTAATAATATEKVIVPVQQFDQGLATQEDGNGESVQRLRTADSRSASIVEDAEDTPLLSLVLKPAEHVQITFVVCPSPHYIDDTTGAVVGGTLVDRDIPLLLQWKKRIAVDRDEASSGSASASAPSVETSVGESSGRHRLALHFRTCTSLISMVPSTMSVYDLGMCSVGEHRTVALEVRNDSDMPTIVFPYVDSEVLDLSETEVRIPPQETRQVKVGFLARSEDPEYRDKVVFLNGYNSDAFKEVKLKSRNVDTQQILLHSMFYKLVTYNNLRQLQLHFDRCLINMPNLRVFSIKNVHSRALRVNVCWDARSGIRLFLVATRTTSSNNATINTVRDSTKSDRSFSSSSTSAMVGPSTENHSNLQLPNVEAEAQQMEQDDHSLAGGGKNGVKNGGEKVRSVGFGGTSGSNSSQQQDDIEDMKWGDDPHDLGGKFNKVRRTMSMQPVKNSAAAGSGSSAAGGASGGGVKVSAFESHVGMSGDDLSVNYGKGGAMYEGKTGNSGNANSSLDLLSVLDLSQSSLSSAAPSSSNNNSTSIHSSAASSNPSNSSAAPPSNEAMSVDDDQAPVLGMVGRRAISDGSIGGSGGSGVSKEVRFNLLPMIGEHGEPSAGSTPLSVATPSSAKTHTVTEDVGLEQDALLLRQFDREEFPFDLLEDADGDFTGGAGGSLQEGGRRNKLPFLDDGGALEEFRKALRPKDSRPHSIGGGASGTLSLGIAGTSGGTETTSREREKSEAEKRVKRIQKAYADLRYMIENAGNEERSCLRELQPDVCYFSPSLDSSTSEVSVTVEIPVGTSYRFALVYEPQQRAGADDIEEYMQVNKSEEVHILLPDMNAADVASSLNINSIMYGTSASHAPDDAHHSHALHDGSLRPRALPIRASLVRSEMVVIQKNISFGRTVLGEKSSRGVTVVNRSSVPCLYTISKSGSISSGFLQVPGGRKGLIPAFSSKVIEFIFRPTLPGNFEEILLINNVLNPRDTQTVTIKARVSHTETFVISPAAEQGTTDASPVPVEEPPVLTAVDAMLKSQLDDLLASQLGSGSVKSVACYLGCGLVGDMSSLNHSSGSNSLQLSFRIKNVTSKPRQFIVDATHVQAVELLALAAAPPPPPSSFSSPPAADPKAQLFPEHDHDETGNMGDTKELIAPSTVSSSHSPSQHTGVGSGSSAADLSAVVTPFEPIPDVLQSVLSLRCRFSSDVVQSQASSTADGKDGTLSAEERQALEDSLEQFQQKLKIAIRKNKAEKIEKYQKKIDKVILSLQSNKKLVVAPPAGIAEVGTAEADVSAVAADEAKTNFTSDTVVGPDVLVVDAATAEEAKPAEEKETKATSTALMSTAAPIPPSQAQSEESEVSYHFQLEPEQERVVRVTLSFLPGAGYRYWTGFLPFHGFLRIFECKNEDHVKVVRYGALIQSARLALPAAMPTPALSKQTMSSTDSAVTDKNLPPEQRNDLNASTSSTALTLVQQGKVSPFLATVAQWSALPTRDIYPKYRQLPQNLLPMCVKLVRASKDRVMHGSLSIASLVELSGTLSLSVDEGFSGKVSSEYSTYNSKRHGSIHFAISMSVAGAGGASSDGGIDLNSADGEIAVGQRSLASTSETTLSLAAGSKVDFSVQWRPPLDFGSNKAAITAAAVESATGEEGGSTPAPASAPVSASLRILGAVKAQLKVGDQVVGTALSIPFIGVLEHTSVMSVDKYFTFEEVSVGSYRTTQIPITNTSTTEELHYIVSSEEVSPACKTMGCVDIVGGQAGIIPPNSSKQLQLLFSASAAGKYEQKLWIRNIRDSFDQKRIVVQATVSLAQTKFVVFPDLESTSTSSFGKYKPIDLGLVQIQSSEGAEALMPLLPPLEQRCYYELRIQNVSGKPLCVTALSNLKSQCFIYGDDNLSQLAIYCPLPVSVLTTLYVVIRPTAVPASAQLASLSEGSAVASEESLPLLDATALQEKVKPKGGRDLVGGIKLVFFPADRSSVVSDTTVGGEEDSAISTTDLLDGTRLAAPSPSHFPLESSPRKLFETAISFRATVGKSTLVVSAAEGCELQYVAAACATAVGRGPATQVDYFVGRFELRNLSKLFPIEYAYVLGAVEDCSGVHVANGADEREHQKSVASALALIPLPKKGELHVRILDARVSLLAPGESRWVTYIVRHAAQASVVALYPVRVANTSTMEVASLPLAIFLDIPGKSSSQPTIEFPKNKDEITGSAEIEDPVALPMRPISCNTAIWVYKHDYSKASAIAAAAPNKPTSATNHANNDPRGEGVSQSVLDDNATAEAVTDAVFTPTNAVDFLVQGTSGGELCTWTYVNDKNKSITFFPASDLPISVKLFALVREPTAGFEGADEKGDYSLFTATSSGATQALSMSGTASDAYSRKISPALLRWRKSLKRCGGAFTIEAGGAVRVVVSARRGAALSEEQLATLGGARRLESGKGGQLQGVVVFLQASHSLQSLFDATPLKDKERIKEMPSAAVSVGLAGSFSNKGSLVSTKEEMKLQDSVLKGSGTITKAKAGNASARSLPDVLADQIEILPIVSISTLFCAIAAPLLSMPEGEVVLGRKRCGQFARFEFSVENPSDVDVPCCIDNMPSWMSIERFHTSLLNKRVGTSGESSIVADGDASSMSTEPFLDMSSSGTTPAGTDLTIQVHQEWSSPRRADFHRHGHGERNLGAQKLHWWVTSNGATISSQQALSPAHSRSVDREADKDKDKSRYSEQWGTRRRRGSKESAAVSEAFSVGDDTAGFSTNATEDDNHYSPSRPTLGAVSDFTLEPAQPYQNQLRTVENRDLDLFKLHQSLLSATNDAALANIKLFAIPAKSRVRATMEVKVPILAESELLQHTLCIKNLASAVIAPQQLNAPSTVGEAGRYLLDRDGSVLVTDWKELSVRLQVDATRALELIAAIDEPFAALPPPLLAEQEVMRTSAYVRLLKDPFLVPPPVEITTLSNSADHCDGTLRTGESVFPIPIEAKSKVSKTHCRFSIKNKLTTSLRVQATVTLNAEVVGLLDMKVNFQTNNSSVIDLEPEEACAVKVRVLPKLDGRMHGIILSPSVHLIQAGLLEESKRKGSLQPSEVVLSTRSKESSEGNGGEFSKPEMKKVNSRSEMLPQQQSSLESPQQPSAPLTVSRDKLLGTPVLLGTVRISPMVSRPPSSLGWLPGLEVERTTDDLHSQDTLLLSIVGYLQPSSTAVTSLALPTSQASSPVPDHSSDIPPAVPVLEFKSIVANDSKMDSSDRSNAAAPSAVVSPVARKPIGPSSTDPLATFDGQMMSISLSDPATTAASTSIISSSSSTKKSLPPQPGKPISALPASPLLALVNNGLTFYVSNPSTGRNLNFAIKTQTYRHAGMRLQLASANSVGEIESVGSSSAAGSGAYDTFYLEAYPSVGCLAPSNLTAIQLRLVPGDSGQAVKSSTTLNADIPDIHMRERRLRSHHGRDHAAAVSAASSLNVAALGMMNSSNTSALIATAGIAGVGVGVGVAETSVGSPDASNPAEGEAATTPVLTKTPASNVFNGPFTLACMPVEVWDTDNLSHPPKLVHAYLTCEVPLPVLVTQGLRDAARQKSQQTSAIVPSSVETENSLPVPSVAPTVSTDGTLAQSPVVDSAALAALSDARLVQLHGSVPVERLTDKDTPSICVLDVGTQVQRKEALEWPLLLENSSLYESIAYTVTPAFPGDLDSWLSLGQTGGVLAPASQTSLMIYFRRSVPPGVYVTYLIVENRLCSADSRVLRVSMEVVLDGKRASAINSNNLSSGNILPPLHSQSNQLLSSSKKDHPSEENLSILLLENSSMSLSMSTDAVEPAVRSPRSATPLSALAPAIAAPPVFEPGRAAMISSNSSGNEGIGMSVPPVPKTAARPRPVFLLQSSAASRSRLMSESKESVEEDNNYRTWEGIASSSPVGLSLSPTMSPVITASKSSRGMPAAPAVAQRQFSDDTTKLYVDAQPTEKPALLLSNLTELPLDITVECTLTSYNKAHGDEKLPPELTVSNGSSGLFIVKPSTDIVQGQTLTLQCTVSLTPRECVRVALQWPPGLAETGPFAYIVMQGNNPENDFLLGGGDGGGEVLGKLVFRCSRFEGQAQTASVVEQLGFSLN